VTRNPGTAGRQVAWLRRKYGDWCWLCGKPIDFTITDIRNPLHYSRDHVIPRARGGSSSRENLRLAHRGCNSRRGQQSPVTAPEWPFSTEPELPC